MAVDESLTSGENRAPLLWEDMDGQDDSDQEYWRAVCESPPAELPDLLPMEDDEDEDADKDGADAADGDAGDNEEEEDASESEARREAVKALVSNMTTWALRAVHVPENCRKRSSR